MPPDDLADVTLVLRYCVMVILQSYYFNYVANDIGVTHRYGMFKWQIAFWK